MLQSLISLNRIVYIKIIEKSDKSNSVALIYFVKNDYNSCVIAEREYYCIMDTIYLRSQYNRSSCGFRSPDYYVPPHRLIRVVKGSGVYTFPNDSLEVSEGMIFLTPPGERAIDFPGEQEVHL